MQINLINGYFVEVDPLNYTLKQKYRPKDKDGNLKEKEAVRTLGYYGKLEDALNGFLRHNQIDILSDLGMGMHEIVKNIEESNKAAVRAIMDVLNGG
ncbi:MAG: hypothetical protein J6Q48_06085 [Bacteroidaceae bacterium]|nr:hypothetical protein [Bacteroidaceae bacterium]